MVMVASRLFDAACDRSKARQRSSARVHSPATAHGLCTRKPGCPTNTDISNEHLGQMRRASDQQPLRRGQLQGHKPASANPVVYLIGLIGHNRHFPLELQPRRRPWVWGICAGAGTERSKVASSQSKGETWPLLPGAGAPPYPPEGSFHWGQNLMPHRLVTVTF